MIVGLWSNRLQYGNYSKKFFFFENAISSAPLFFRICTKVSKVIGAKRKKKNFANNNL